MSTPQHEGYVDAKAFEKEFSLSARTFFFWIQTGKLEPYKPSRRKTLAKRSDINKLIEASKVENPINKLVDEVMADMGADR